VLHHRTDLQRALRRMVIERERGELPVSGVS
jgi:hypothetical protein